MAALMDAAPTGQTVWFLGFVDLNMFRGASIRVWWPVSNHLFHDAISFLEYYFKMNNISVQLNNKMHICCYLVCC